MYTPLLGLVPMPVAARRPNVRRSFVLYGLGIAGVTAIALFPAALAVVSISAITACAISGFALGGGGTRPGTSVMHAIEPESLASYELRETYRTVLFALAELERTISEAPRLHAPVAPVRERCHAVVASCGRMARLADPLQQYLDDHDPAYMRWELDRLRARAEAAHDDTVVAALTHAAAARTRQLATYEQIAGQRDRIHARLELVRAAIESFTAMLVKLRGADEEQLVLGNESIPAQLDEVGDELAVLESVLEADLAA